MMIMMMMTSGRNVVFMIILKYICSEVGDKWRTTHIVVVTTDISVIIAQILVTSEQSKKPDPENDVILPSTW